MTSPRPAPDVTRPADVTPRATAEERPPIAAADVQRLVYAREGGGAPGERRVGAPDGWLERLWRLVGLRAGR